MKLLVVEDEPDLLHAISQTLRESGYAVDEAQDGQVALGQATTGDYAAIVLDVMLPGMDGMRLVRELRRSHTTPVLMLTARDAPRDRVKGLDAGADDYLVKPFELSELLARVRSVIRRGAGGALSVPHGGEVTGTALAGTVSKLRSAGEVQRKLTSPESLKVDRVELAFHYQPASWVGGDHCDAWTLPDGRLAFAMADVAGKGVPAAIVMANLQASLHAAMAFCHAPAAAVNYVNEHLRRHLPQGPFVTLFLGLLDPATGALHYVNAGHEPPMIATADGAHRLGAPLNTMLGVADEAFVADAATLAPGECLVAFTDGVTEAASPGGELFGSSRVLGAVNALRQQAAQAIVEGLVNTAAEFRGAEPAADDISVLAVRWLGQKD